MKKVNYCENRFRQKKLDSLCLLLTSIVFQCDKVNAQNTAGYNRNNVAIGGGGFISALIISKDEQRRSIFY